MIAKTAYSKPSAENYDALRFETPQGIAFHQLELRQLLASVAKLQPGARCLEVGCGTGRFVAELAQRGFWVRGLDASEHMLAEAQEKTGSRQNVDLLVGEAASLPFHDGEFDFVYSIRMLNQTESVDYAKRAICEIARVTKPGGLMLIEFCNATRPLQKRQGVRLTFADVMESLSRRGRIDSIRKTGILVLSGTVLDKTPTWLIPAYKAVDRVVGSSWPTIASRCYIEAART